MEKKFQFSRTPMFGDRFKRFKENLQCTKSINFQLNIQYNVC